MASQRWKIYSQACCRCSQPVTVKRIWTALQQEVISTCLVKSLPLNLRTWTWSKVSVNPGFIFSCFFPDLSGDTPLKQMMRQAVIRKLTAVIPGKKAELKMQTKYLDKIQQNWIVWGLLELKAMPSGMENGTPWGSWTVSPYGTLWHTVLSPIPSGMRQAILSELMCTG